MDGDDTPFSTWETKLAENPTNSASPRSERPALSRNNFNFGPIRCSAASMVEPARLLDTMSQLVIGRMVCQDAAMGAVANAARCSPPGRAPFATTAARSTPAIEGGISPPPDAMRRSVVFFRDTLYAGCRDRGSASVFLNHTPQFTFFGHE